MVFFRRSTLSVSPGPSDAGGPVAPEPMTDQLLGRVERSPGLSRNLASAALWLALLACLSTVMVAVAFLLYDSERQRSSALNSVELYARMLEDQTSRGMAGADAMVRLVADGLAEGAAVQRLTSVLQDSARRQPLLRSLSLLDGRYRVVASSQPDNVGRVVPPELLGPLPAKPGDTRLGPLRAGRDLSDLHAPGLAYAATHAMPLLRWLPDAQGRPAWILVALINPDYLATEYERLIDDSGLRVTLFTDEGVLIGGGPLETLPGQRMPLLKPFRNYLPAREHASYVDQGLDGQMAFVAFRASRRWPLVVLVEQPALAVEPQRVGTQRAVLALAGLVCALVWVAAWLVRRNLRKDEAHTRRLQAAQSAAREQEIRRRAILEASIDAIVTIDDQGQVVDFNPAAEYVFRCPRGELGQHSLFELLSPTYRQRYQYNLEQYRAGRATLVLNQRMEIEAQRLDGHVFPVEMSMVPVRTGERLYFTATLRDITIRREVEAERAALLTRYQALATDLERQKLALDEHAIVSITDAQGLIVYANAKLAQISGYAPEELLGHKHNVLKSGRQSLEVYQALWATISQGRIWHGELVNRRKSGRLYWVACTIVPVPGEDGLPRQYISIQTDTTALRQAELALAEAHQRELEIGARIQQSLLVTPPSSQSPELWISAYNQASQGIDGDFVEVFRLGEDCVDIVVGDVMGKGLSAALIGAATKLQFSRSMTELLARAAGQWAEPAQIVAAVHAAMTPHLQALNAFVTLCHVRLDLARRRVTWVGCGHEEPLLASPEVPGVRRLENQHPPLGILDSDDYQQDTLPLQPGDVLFLCSDGVTDAVRPDGERVGREQLMTLLEPLVRQVQTPAALLQVLKRALLFQGVQLNDDVTMVLAMHRQARPGTLALSRRQELPADLAVLHDVRDFCDACTAEAALPEHEAALLSVAMVEAFTNVIRHARNRPADAPIELVGHGQQDERGRQVLVLEVVSLGDAFYPAAPREADLTTFPEGGFGLSIIRGACDKVEYLHAQGVNTVRMQRYLSGWVPPVR